MSEDKKRHTILDYVHFTMATINVVIMIGMSLIYNSVLWLEILSIGVSILLYGVFMYLFMRKNPYYFILNYSSTIFSIIIIAFNLFFFWVLLLPLIIYLIYLFSLLDISWFKATSRKRFIARYGFMGYSPSQENEMWHDNAVDSIKQRYKELLKETKKKYKVNLIYLVTLFLSASFIVLYILYNILGFK
ncbi:MAG: hypothetical protein ACFFD1_11505 [Candidatus Thorarchaeota archaeon]